MMKRIVISALVANCLALAGGDIAPVEPVIETPVVEDSNAWKNELTIYAWVPTISATTPFPGSPTEPDVLDDLKMAFMGGYSGRNDSWSVFADLIYFNLGDSKNSTLPILGDLHRSYDLKSLVVQGGVGYNLVNNGNGLLDVIGGVRYLGLDLDITSTLFGEIPSVSKDFTDFFIGVKGYKNINENWYIPYEADIGTGDTDLSWQVFAGVGYRYDWGDIKLGYRYLEFDMEDDAILEDLTADGAIFGVSIKF